VHLIYLMPKAHSREQTTTAILSTIYALLLYPEVQAKVQAELDTVLRGAPPTAEDRQRLPYLEAVWKEALRWHPPVPLSKHYIHRAPVSF
jgi:cytochrome P450